MTKSITPPIEPIEPPHRPTRADILNEYWWEFAAIQLQKVENIERGGMGLKSGLFSESEFWDFIVRHHRDVLQEVLNWENDAS